jgi:hypothetical protein
MAYTLLRIASSSVMGGYSRLIVVVGPAVLEPGAIFIPVLEELVELISVATWRELWTWVESNSKRFTAVG